METLRIHHTDLEKLREIIGTYIGTKTASSLSMLLNESVTHRIRRIMEIGSLDIESVVPVFDIIPMCSVYLKGNGDVRIGLMFFLPSSAARKLASKLLGVQTMKRLSSLGRSSILEAGNIMAGSFFNALSDGTGFRIDLTTPGFGADTFKALIEPSIMDMSSSSNSMIVADAELRGFDSDIVVDILVFCTISDAQKLIAFQK